MLRKIGNKIKKYLAILSIIVLLPYIITVFANGGGMESSSGGSEFDKLLKDHCINVLAKEVSSDYEEEMLKAQAILVRTTIYKEVEELGQDILEQEGFGKIEDVDAAWYRELERIWEETKGQVVMYGDKPALVPFHQLSNGKTRSGHEVLGSDAYPYLKVKNCEKDIGADAQMQTKVIPVTGVQILTSDSAGYVLEMKVGEEACSGESFRDTYELASSCFEVQEFDGKTRVITSGVGHGLGMSQYTANEMAKEGKGYKEILQYFFEGTEIREVAEILWETE